MNKKNITIGITCGFLLVAGVCYCLTFAGCGSTKALTSTLSNENVNTKELKGDTQNGKTTSNGAKKGTLAADITQSPAKVSKAPTIYVHICGAVKKPGVYKVRAGARIYDLIKQSGGLRKNAAGDYINQAQKVTDGQRIYIPMKKEVDKLAAGELVQENQENTQANKEEASGLININTASAEELMTLPGIGQTKADSIIEYRKTNGSFKAIDELMNITGIKEGVFNRISSYITTG